MKFKVKHPNLELLKAFKKVGLELELKLKWTYSQGRCCEKKKKKNKKKRNKQHLMFLDYKMKITHL